MHIAEGILPIRDAGFWAAVSAPVVAWSAHQVRKAREHAEPRARALFSLGFAFAFAATVFPVPVPIAGVSSHMCMTPLLALILGPTSVVLPTAIILLIQAVFFAHGGLTSLGANVFTLGIVVPYSAWVLARFLRRFGVSTFWTAALVCFFADVAVYLADAAILAWSFHGERPYAYWFKLIALGFAPGQVPLALLEGALSGYLLKSLSQRHPDLTPVWLRTAHRSARISPGGLQIASMAILIWVGLCLVPAVTIAQQTTSEPALSTYSGLDEIVIEHVAKQAGRPAGKPFLPVDSGDVGLFVWGLGGFVSGIVVGVNWMKLQARNPASEAVP